MLKSIVEIDADLQDLIPQFVENRKKDIETLQQLVQQDDLEAISQLAHKIKGAAAGYGFNELSELAAKMESASKKRDHDPLPDLVQQMDRHFRSIEIQYVNM